MEHSETQVCYSNVVYSQGHKCLKVSESVVVAYLSFVALFLRVFVLLCFFLTIDMGHMSCVGTR